MSKPQGLPDDQVSGTAVEQKNVAVEASRGFYAGGQRGLLIRFALPRWMMRTLWTVFWFILMLIVLVAGSVAWLAAFYRENNPLVLDGLMPTIRHVVQTSGGPTIDVGRLSLFYDHDIVIQAEMLQVYGPDGELGAFVEVVQVRLATKALMNLRLSPRELLANGVTVRVVREAKQVRIAGMEQEAKASKKGGDSVIDILNKWQTRPLTAYLHRIDVRNLTLLVRDDDRQAEWVLEQANVLAMAGPGEGQKALIDGTLRRLYGETDGLEKVVTSSVLGEEADARVPVQLMFTHNQGASKAEMSMLFMNANVVMVKEYLPLTMADTIRGTGMVTLGTTLDEHNKVEDPWTTLKLKDVVVLPPKGYSAPWAFKEIELTATYKPGDNDVLQLSKLKALSDTGIVVQGHGEVRNLSSDPELLLDFESVSGGKLADIWIYFPDLLMNETTAWLKENIQKGSFSNLTARLSTTLSELRDCADECGLLIEADIKNAEVKFLKTMPPVRDVNGTFKMHGQTIEVNADAVKLGNQQGKNVSVALTHLIDKNVPTHVLVKAQVSGDAGELIEELRELIKLDKNELPGVVQGQHASGLSLDVPLEKHKDPEIEDIGIRVDSTLRNVALSDVPLFSGAFVAPSATVVIDEKRDLTIKAQGRFEGMGSGAAVTVKDKLDAFGKAVAITVDGHVPAALVVNGLKAEKLVRASNDIVGRATIVRQGDEWRFDGKASGKNSEVLVPLLAWGKPVGQPLEASVAGVFYLQSELSPLRVVLNELAVTGRDVQILGTMNVLPDRLIDSDMRFEPFNIGRNDVSLSLASNTLVVKGKALDISGLDLVGGAEELVPDASDRNILLRAGGLVTGAIGGVVTGAAETLTGAIKAVVGSSDRADEQTKPVVGVAAGSPDDDEPDDKFNEELNAALDGLNVMLDVERVWAKQGDLTGVNGLFAHRDGRWDINSFYARVTDGGLVNIAMKPDTRVKDGRVSDGRVLLIDLTRTGQTLRALGIYDRLRGGRMKGEIRYDAEGNGKGEILLEDFELRRPPVLVQILSLLSLEQIITGNDTLIFNEACVPMQLQGDLVRLNNALLNGPSMSLRVTGDYNRKNENMQIDGQLAPGIPLNRFVAQIPLLGRLLAGSQDAVVVADFTVSGDADAPQVGVKPLSVITPGLIKDLWGVIVDEVAPAKPEEQQKGAQ